MLPLRLWDRTAYRVSLKESIYGTTDTTPPEAREQALREGGYSQVVAWADGDEERLREVAKARGYQSGWVWYQRNGR
jgi:hypothetical protein